MRRRITHEMTITPTAMMASHGTPNSEPLPMNSNGRSELNTVVSPPSSRATPRTAVSDPNVTMKGGRLR